MKTEGDQPSKRVSTKLCEPCRQAGKECLLSFQKWGNGEIRWSCECCGNSWVVEHPNGHGGSLDDPELEKS